MHIVIYSTCTSYMKLYLYTQWQCYTLIRENMILYSITRAVKMLRIQAMWKTKHTSELRLNGVEYMYL